MRKRNIWANFKELLFTQKLSLTSQKYGFEIRGIRDPGSRTRKKPTLDLGSRGQKGTGSRVPDPDPQHWFPGLLSWSGQAPVKARIYLHKTLVFGFYLFNFVVLVWRWRCCSRPWRPTTQTPRRRERSPPGAQCAGQVSTTSGHSSDYFPAGENGGKVLEPLAMSSLYFGPAENLLFPSPRS